MQPTRPLELLFLTNFSDSSYRAIPALAQLSDELDVRITLLHASRPSGKDGSDAEALLASFFPEADAYRTSRRVVHRGHVIDAVKELRQRQPVDLIVAPSSDPLGLPRPLHTSLRARLLQEGGAPLWTMGQPIHTAVLNRRTRNVGCWVDLASMNTTHISLAFEYASKMNARIHLLHALPEIHEGSLALPLYYDKPLYEEGAADEIRTLLGWTPMTSEIHIAPGNCRKLMPKMVRDLALDIVFADKEQSLRGGWARSGISSAVNRCECPVICCDSSQVGIWRLGRGSAFEIHAVPAKAA